ncbi:MAG: glycosyltransferase family A protein [Flavobacteriaceae bacterium]
MDALVSVIIPTYARTPLLKQTLESVGQQTYHPIEIIVVDDGSTGKENQELCANYPLVRYHKIENSGGPAKPRNEGAKLAKGVFIAFLDDDDLWIPTKLEKQVQLLQDHPEYGLVHTPCKVIDEEGAPTGEIIGKPRTQSLKHGDVALRMAGNWTLMTSSVLIRKDLFNQVGGFNETMPPAGEDTEFWTRCSFQAKFYYWEEPSVLYRRHQSISAANKPHYFDVPLYLKKSIDVAFRQHLLTRHQAQVISRQVVKKQVKDMHNGRWKTFKRLFLLNPLWFLNFGNIRLFIKKIISP